MIRCRPVNNKLEIYGPALGDKVFLEAARKAGTITVTYREPLTYVLEVAEEHFDREPPKPKTPQAPAGEITDIGYGVSGLIDHLAKSAKWVDDATGQTKQKVKQVKKEKQDRAEQAQRLEQIETELAGTGRRTKR